MMKTIMHNRPAISVHRAALGASIVGGEVETWFVIAPSRDGSQKLDEYNSSTRRIFSSDEECVCRKLPEVSGLH